MPSAKLLVVKDKVQRFAKEVFNVVNLEDDGNLIVFYESTAIHIMVNEFNLSPEEAKTREELDLPSIIVQVWAPVLQEVPMTPQLFEWVALEGHYNFGNYRVVPLDNRPGANLILTYNLVGDTLDSTELKNAIVMIANTADDDDDELKKRFGGDRVSDR